MTKTAAPAAIWPTLTVAALLACHTTPEADPELTASITEQGISDPLYVVTTGSGEPRIVDGVRRLAAAAAAELTEVPVTYRPVIAIGALTAHPGNVRTDLRMSKEFRASVHAEGVRVPVKVTRTGATGLQVIDGHRRLAAAVAEKLTHIPFEYEERDDAGQFLDMVTTARHRESLTVAEEVTALFSAAEAGASVKRLAAAVGRTQKDTKTAVRIGGSEAARMAAATASYSLDLEELGQLADLEEADPEAARRVSAAIKDDPDGSHGWTIRREAVQVERRQEAATHGTALEAAGRRIRTEAELSDKARPVRAIPDITQDGHETCQGSVWVLEEGDRQYTQYCTSPTLYGHQATAAEAKPGTAQIRIIRKGNVDWDAAEQIRRQWLTETISRKTHPKGRNDQFLMITTRAMLAGSGVLADKLNHGGATDLLAQFLALPKDTSRTVIAERADSAARHNPAHLFATLAAAYEQYMPRSTWRTDGSHKHEGAHARKQAVRWFGWLVELGYEPTPIEAAVIAGEPYNPLASDGAEAINEE